MIKLVLLIPTLDGSGAEKQLTLLATGLPRETFDVHVVALTRGGPYEAVLRDAGVRVTLLDKRSRFDPLAMLRLGRLLRRERPDILHTWLFAASAYGRIVAGRESDPKIVVSERCVDSWKAFWQLRLDRYQIRRTDRLIANSKSVADFYRYHGYTQQRVSVIPNGVHVPGPPVKDRKRMLAEFGIPASAKVVGYVGRMARQKRVHDLVWAIQLLRQVTEDVYLLIIGDGPERDRCVDRARHYACEHVIRFAGHRDDAAEIMPHLNVFWLASDFEGMSNSLMEAMAAGVPAVVSDIPANCELVVDGETGYVVRVGDSVGFCQFTDRIMSDSALTRRLGDASRARMRNYFSVQAMIDAHMRVYRELLHPSYRRQENP